MVDPSESAQVRITLLTAHDEADLLAFERTNREFFARTVGDRGDEFFASFPARHRNLVHENESGISMLFVVRDAQGRVVGRVNIGPIFEGGGEIGYRIAESACGRGYARAAVRQAVDEAARRGLSRLAAKTTVDNVASRRVLEANGFEQVDHGEPAVLEVGGRTFEAVHFTRPIPRLT